MPRSNREGQITFIPSEKNKAFILNQSEFYRWSQARIIQAALDYARMTMCLASAVNDTYDPVERAARIEDLLKVAEELYVYGINYDSATPMVQGIALQAMSPAEQQEFFKLAEEELKKIEAKQAKKAAPKKRGVK